MNYFEFYGLSPSLAPDPELLKKKFLEASRKHHPDHFVLKPELEKEEAEEWSAFNNKAYRTLSNPDLLFKYILELKGLTGEGEGDQSGLSQEFLMEMMDIHDLILEDPVKADLQLEAAENSIRAEIDPLILHFDFDKASGAELESLKEYYFKRRYILRLRENLNKFAADQRP
ncbi:MAG TPA: iron-sulfur cluster co-chaperone HscB C-terminal domain-containing protein [Saprospiraceae bacterium]|nr:iron-sulfur cluster co-chaperone HscB C-terminal domain-containing protein [Saprospiraceae bacterium]HNT18908.1 iron-sulfur cluster co-chaperone HscB C-terminal domain-containing protein [Saprospiraceae bacterium]